MSDPINLAAERQARKPIWVCNCGCTTHHHHGDGDVECAACGNIASGSNGSWLTRLPATPDEPLEFDETQFKVVPMLSAAMFLQRRLAEDTRDIVGIVMLHTEGTVATYNGLGEVTDERRVWLADQLEIARKRLLGEPG